MAWLLARRLAAESAHPVSRALAGRDPVPGLVNGVEESPGCGLQGTVDGHRVAIGGSGFVREHTGRAVADRPGFTCVAVDDAIGWVRLTAPERPGLREAVRTLAAEHELWLLSGDDPVEAARFEELFGPRMRFRQSAEDKLAFVHELRAAGRHVLMVGDGLNDAGALAAADAGIAVSDDTACLVPACDAVVRGDQLRLLPAILRYARLGRSVVGLCFAVSVAYNLIGLSLALAARLTPLGRSVVGLCFAVSVAYNLIGLSLALAARLTPLATAILMPISSLTIVGLSVGLMRRGARRAFRPGSSS